MVGGHSRNGRKGEQRDPDFGHTPRMSDAVNPGVQSEASGGNPRHLKRHH